MSKNEKDKSARSVISLGDITLSDDVLNKAIKNFQLSDNKKVKKSNESFGLTNDEQKTRSKALDSAEDLLQKSIAEDKNVEEKVKDEEVKKETLDDSQDSKKEVVVLDSVDVLDIIDINKNKKIKPPKFSEPESDFSPKEYNDEEESNEVKKKKSVIKPNPNDKKGVLRIDHFDGEIDISEYEMLYGGSITVKSSHAAIVSNMPKKKKRLSSSVSYGKTSSPSSSSSNNEFVEFFAGMTVKDFAISTSMKIGSLLKKIMSLGLNYTVNSTLDEETVLLIALEYGLTVKHKKDPIIERIEQRLKDNVSGKDEKVPVVAIMGHVDHGKTSLLDKIRQSKVVDGESGGITQHIGAYSVKTPKGKDVTFIDTPGHMVFNEMRARGAQITDIAILVVAGDDGIKPQTIEAINHIKDANTPMIVAVNKLDKPGFNLENVKSELMKYDVVSEEYGGNIMIVPVSALTGQGIEQLLESISLQAEIMELSADNKADPFGFIIEGKMDKQKGPVSTLLIKDGTLKKGDIVVSNHASGRVRFLVNDQGQRVDKVKPGYPIGVYGLDSVAIPGDRFVVVNSEKDAKKIKEFLVNKKSNLTKKPDAVVKDIFADEVSKLNLIIKSDVGGSLEAIVSMLNKIKTDEVDLRIIQTGVGNISESDIDIAVMSKSVVLGFNVIIDSKAKKIVDKQKVNIMLSSTVYDLEDNVKRIIISMLKPIVKENVIGVADVKQIFNISKLGNVAGCSILSGVVRKGCIARIERKGDTIGQFNITALKRAKDEVKEVSSGHDCGIYISDSSVDVQHGDKVEIIEFIEEQRSLNDLS